MARWQIFQKSPRRFGKFTGKPAQNRNIFANSGAFIDSDFAKNAGHFLQMPRRNDQKWQGYRRVLGQIKKTNREKENYFIMKPSFCSRPVCEIRVQVG